MKISAVTVGVDGHFPHLAARLVSRMYHYSQYVKCHAWINEYAPGSPSHQEKMYAFKAHALMRVFDRDKPDVLMWIDSAYYPIKDVRPMIVKILRDGYYIQESPYKMGQWASDSAIRNFGIDRETAMGIQESRGGFFGVDARTDDGASFIEDFYRFSTDGSTLGTAEMNDNGLAQRMGVWQPHRGVAHLSDDPRVIGHRSCQTIVSFLGWKRGWVGTPMPNLCNYKVDHDKHPDDRTIFLNWGGG